MHKLNKEISKIDVLLPPVEYIKKILGAICDSLGYSFASVVEVDDAGEGKMLVSYNLPVGYPECVNEVDAPLLLSPFGEAIETDRIVVVTDSRSESRLMPWNDLLQDYSLQTIIWVPLFKEGKAFGTYVLYDTKKRDVSKRELEVFEQIGVMVSIAITSNHYLDKFIIGAKGRKLAENNLNESEIRFKNIYSHSPIGIELYDSSGNLIDANSKCLEIFGVDSVDDIKGFQLFEDLNLSDDIIQKLKNGESIEYQYALDFDIIKERALYETTKSGKCYLNIALSSFKAGENDVIGYLVHVRDITKRKLAQDALAESEKRYKSLFNNASDGIFIHALDGQFIDANDVGCGFLGYTHDELMLMTVMDLHTPQIAPKIKPRLLDVLQHDSITNEAKVEWNGGITSLEIKSQLIEYGKDSVILSIARDITERRQAEKALAKSEELFRTLYSTMNEGVALHEIIYSESGEPVDYRILNVNPAFESILGIKKEDAKGARATELYGTSEAPYLDLYAKVAASSDSITFESTFEPIGKTLKIAVFSPGVDKFATLFADITERKKMENALKNSHMMLEHRVAERTGELEKANRELSDANVKLREVDVMKSEFLDTVSHELRTPLTSIIGYSSLLLDGIQGEMNEKQTQYVEGIWRKGMHQLELVNDILTLSKLESRSMSVNLESVSISKSIEDLMGDVIPLLKDKQHETGVEIAEGVGDVRADRVRLRQILLNLISNAIKFTPDNGKIIIKVLNENEMVRISIIDNGIGIQQEDVDKLFNRFIQIDQSSTRRVGGTGLGLAIVKDMVELMGGSVELETEFGKGSTFSILLPKVQSQDANNE